jgi:hypothetical protein
MIRRFSLGVLFLGLSPNISDAQTFKITGSIPIGVTGHWDYLLSFGIEVENRDALVPPCHKR